MRVLVQLFTLLSAVSCTLSSQARFIVHTLESTSNLINVTRDTLISLSMLPIEVVNLLNGALEDGYHPEVIAAMAREYSTHPNTAAQCIKKTPEMKGFHLCMLRESGFNPLHIHILQNLRDHRVWCHLITPFDGIILKDFSQSLLEIDAAYSNDLQEGIDGLYQSTVACQFEKLMSDDPDICNSKKNFDFCNLFSEYVDILCQVPVIDSSQMITEPSHLLPIIIRHFLLNNQYQKIIDHLDFNWNTLPIALIEELFKDLHEISEAVPEVLQGVKDFNYSRYALEDKRYWLSWWPQFYAELVRLPGFMDAIITAITRAYNFPSDLSVEIIPLAKFSTFDMLIVEVKTVLDQDVRIKLLDLNLLNEFQVSDFYGIRWDLYKPILEELLPVMRLMKSHKPRIPFPPTPNDLAMTFFNGILATEIPSLDALLILLHQNHPDFSESLIKAILDPAESISTILVRFESWRSMNWSSLFNEILSNDIQTIFKLCEPVNTAQPIESLKNDLYLNLIKEIKQKGAPHFETVEFPLPKTWTTWPQSLIDIRDMVYKALPRALWLALNIPMMYLPDFPSAIPKTVWGSLLHHIVRGLDSVNEDHTKSSLINSIWREILGDNDLDRIVDTWDALTVIRLYSLAVRDPIEFLEELTRSCGHLLTENVWLDIAFATMINMNITVDDDEDTLPTLTSYDSILAFLRSLIVDEAAVHQALHGEDYSISLFKDITLECPICLVPFSDDDGNLNVDNLPRATRQCGHFFHLSCLVQALTVANHLSCPYCRTHLSR